METTEEQSYYVFEEIQLVLPPPTPKAVGT